MAGIGLALIHKIITEKLPITFFSDNGIDEDSFKDKEEREVFNFIIGHTLDYGQYPALKTIETEVENIKFGRYPDEPVGFYLDRFEQRNSLQTIITTLNEVKKCVDESDVEEAKDLIKSLSFTLEQNSKTDHIVSIEQVGPEVLIDHAERQKQEQIKGVPFGIQFIDQVSDGAQPTDTVAFVGRPGVGKSYLLLNSANVAWDAKEVPLFATYEMSPKQCVRRILALRTHINATDIRMGRVSHWGTRILSRGVHLMQESETRNPFYILQGSLHSTVEDLALRVKEYRPSVLYVDGAYLLKTKFRAKSKWEIVSDVAEWLKDIAMDNNIPVIATYQFNRKGSGDLGNIGYSDTIGQLASIVIGIANETANDVGEGWVARQYKILELLKGREGEKGVVRALYDMQRMEICQDLLISGFSYLDAAIEADIDRIPARIGDPASYNDIGIVLPNSRLFGGTHSVDGEDWWK